MTRLHILTAPFLDTGEGTGSGGELSGAEVSTLSGDETGSPDPADGSDASPTVTPAETAGGGAPPAMIPLDRHESILANARRDADDVARQLGWARGMDVERVRRALSTLDHIERDPGGYARHLSSELHAGQEPGPDIEDDRGQRFYSPQQAVALADYRANVAVSALERKLDARFAPLEQATHSAAANSHAEAQVQEAMAWPLFEANMNEITDVIAEGRRRGMTISLWQAYAHVVHPKLSASEKALEAKLRKQIAAELNGESLNNDTDPSRSARAQSRVKDSDKSIEQLLAEEHARVERAGSAIA